MSEELQNLVDYLEQRNQAELLTQVVGFMDKMYLGDLLGKTEFWQENIVGDMEDYEIASHIQDHLYQQEWTEEGEVREAFETKAGRKMIDDAIASMFSAGEGSSLPSWTYFDSVELVEEETWLFHCTNRSAASEIESEGFIGKLDLDRLGLTKHDYMGDHGSEGFAFAYTAEDFDRYAFTGSGRGFECRYGSEVLAFKVPAYVRVSHNTDDEMQAIFLASDASDIFLLEDVSRGSMRIGSIETEIEAESAQGLVDMLRESIEGVTGSGKAYLELELESDSAEGVSNMLDRFGDEL